MISVDYEDNVNAGISLIMYISRYFYGSCYGFLPDKIPANNVLCSDEIPYIVLFKMFSCWILGIFNV